MYLNIDDHLKDVVNSCSLKSFQVLVNITNIL